MNQTLVCIMYHDDESWPNVYDKDQSKQIEQCE